MKKIILTIGICIVSLVAVNAQTSGKGAATLDQKVAKVLYTLTATCNLTPDQVTQARPIVEETIKARTANRAQYGSDKDKLRAANKETMKAENAKMSAILNADQQAKLIAYERQRVQKMKAAKTTSSQGQQ